MLSETQIRTAKAATLEDLRNRIEAELIRRELEEREPPENRRAVVEERPVSAGTLRLEVTKCGKKKRCRKCSEGGGHGPSYWYLYYRRSGKLTSRYIAKMIPDDLQARG